MSSEIMNRDAGNGRCFSRETLGTLAIRIAQGSGDSGAPGEGSPDSLPGDLFLPSEEVLRRHLENCPACRKKLLEEVCSARRYLDGLENPANVERFETIMSRASEADVDTGPEDGIIETILHFDAYGTGTGEVALAAASESKDTQPIRFSSEDGTMILREFPGAGSGQSRYQLIADDSGLTGNAEVIVGEQSMRTSPEGILDLEDTQVEITRGITIIIRSRRN